MTFRMAGDFGDLIYALPVVRYLCDISRKAGRIMFHTERWTRDPMTPKRWAAIAPLLEAQPYVASTGHWDGKPVNVNLNDFRADYFDALKKAGGFLKPGFPKRRSICEWILNRHGVPLEAMSIQWLWVTPSPKARVVFNRTGRYNNEKFPWQKIVEKYGDQAVFIGTPAEYRVFSSLFPSVTYHPTATLLDAARVIGGCELFVGNQSACYAIAEAMKRPAILEVCTWLPNCLFNRPDCWHGWDGDLFLPELK